MFAIAEANNMSHNHSRKMNPVKLRIQTRSYQKAYAYDHDFTNFVFNIQHDMHKPLKIIDNKPFVVNAIDKCKPNILKQMPLNKNIGRCIYKSKCYSAKCPYKHPPGWNPRVVKKTIMEQSYCRHWPCTLDYCGYKHQSGQIQN